MGDAGREKITLGRLLGNPGGMNRRGNKGCTTGQASLAVDARATAPTIQYWDGRLATINTPEYSRFLLEYPGICYWLGTANPGVEERR